MIISAAVILLFAAQVQTTAPKPKTVSSIEDIEIGMSADPVIAGLTKQGYSLEDSYHGQLPKTPSWSVSFNGSYVGNFDVENGQVTKAEKVIYDSQFPPKTSLGAIGFAEALYWIFYDHGVTLPSKNSLVEMKEKTGAADFVTRDVDLRLPGASMRMLFVYLSDGNHYRIQLTRHDADGIPPGVSVVQLAPFVIKK